MSVTACAANDYLWCAALAALSLRAASSERHEGKQHLFALQKGGYYIDMAQSNGQASILLRQISAREPKLGRLPKLLKVLADPTRLRIVGFLAQRELCVCDLEEILGVSQSMASHHLGVLRRAGLLLQRREDRDARWVYYRLNPEAAAQLVTQFGGLLDLTQFDETPAACR